MTVWLDSFNQKDYPLAQDNYNSPDYHQRVDDFLQQKTFAVAGVSRNGQAVGNAIFEKLQKSGYTVFALNPSAMEIGANPAYNRLQDIPQNVDVLVIATASAAAPELVQQCINLHIRRVWMHRSIGNGSYSKQAADLCRENGITVLESGCPLMFCAPADPFHRCLREGRRFAINMGLLRSPAVVTLERSEGSPARKPEKACHRFTRIEHRFKFD